MPRLSDATLPAVTAQRPAYDRSSVRPGIVHLGLGAFARAHLAVYVDDLLGMHESSTAIVGVSLRHDDVARALTPQDGLYTVGVLDGTDVEHRVVGSVIRVLHAPTHATEVRDALCAPSTSLVTITVTEKGYCSDPATRRLDRDHPDVRHDIAHPDRPLSLPGHLLLAARDRAARNAGPLTVASLDNLPGNGAVTRSLLLELAGIVDPAAAAWIEQHMSFPCSMVDRMVPATDDTFRSAVSATIGADDAWPVRAERYSQWVVESDWATEPPPFSLVGVQMADDVSGWETLKLRVLNGLHTTAALYGLRHGITHVDAVVADAGGRRLLERVSNEIAEVVEAPSGTDVPTYVATTLQRFANSGLAHRCAQVATDSSHKLPQRVLATVRDRRAAGAPVDALADVLALWAWSTLGRDHLGAPRAVDDPLAPTYARLAAAHASDPPGLVQALFSLEQVFGDLRSDTTLVDDVTRRLLRLL